MDDAVHREELSLSEADQTKTGLAVAALQDCGSDWANVPDGPRWSQMVRNRRCHRGRPEDVSERHAPLNRCPPPLPPVRVQKLCRADSASVVSSATRCALLLLLSRSVGLRQLVLV